MYPLDGIFNGSVSVGGPPNRLTGKINGVFTEVTWSGKSVGTISGSLDYSDQKVNIVEALVATDMGDYTLTGRVDLEADPKLSVRITSDNTRLQGLVKWLPVTSAFQLDGTAKINCIIEGQVANPYIQGEVSLINPVFGPLQMEQGIIKVEGNLNELSVTEFNLTKQDAKISINGKISKDQLDLNIIGSALQLETLQLMLGERVLSGSIDVQGSITGALLNPVFRAQISGKELSIGKFDFQQLAAQMKSQFLGHWKLSLGKLKPGSNNSISQW